VVTEASLARTRRRTGEERCGVVDIVRRGSLHESKDGNQGRREGKSARRGSVSSGRVKYNCQWRRGMTWGPARSGMPGHK